jgi:hypothetical protein
MDQLDIPPEVQAQITPKEVEVELPGDVPQQPPPDQAPQTELPAAEPEVEEEEEPEAEPEQVAASDQPKPDKRQKRINRLTRQKSELQGKLDAAFQQNQELLQQLQQIQGAQTAQAGPAVPGQSRLQWIRNEVDLDREINAAKNMVDWCDSNESGEGLTDEQISPLYRDAVSNGDLMPEEAKAKTIALWRREADKVVRDGPQRKDEIRAYQDYQSRYTESAKAMFPTIFDENNVDHKAAMQLIKDNPVLATMPDKMLIAGLLVEGYKSVIARNGQQPQRQHRDIDERAFGPRVPLAPHSANPPTRPASPSSKQKLDEATSNLIKDVDGSASSVAKMFAALESARPSQRPSPRTPVHS